MAIRIYDPGLFTAQGAVLDLIALMRQQGRQRIAATTGSDKARVLYLRWQTSPEVGLPSEPFKVWRRPALPLGEHHPVGFEQFQIQPLFQVIQFDQPLASVSLQVESSAGGLVTIAVLCGPPTLESVVTLQSRTLPAGGSRKMEFEAGRITGLLLINVSSFADVSGMTVKELESVQSWQLVETVGLPVKEADWASLGQHHGSKQGMAGAEVEAIDAAVDRFKRGVNPLGWWPTLGTGAAAPLWELPDPLGLVEECALELFPLLQQVAGFPPDQQAAKLFPFAIDPPQNPAGDAMPAVQPGKADLSPIGLLAMAASSDPQLAVALGYGTGYPDEDIPQITLGDRALFGDSTRSDWDWLITGVWEKGLDGHSDTVELAALVPRPGLALPAPSPADLQVDFQAHLRPAAIDQPWLASIRTSWERFPLTMITAVASFAAARHATGSATPAEALLTPRTLTRGYRPIGNARNERDPEPTRQSATDGALPIPNNPGTIAMTYAAATQTIFGVWSPWMMGPISLNQPGPAVVQVLAADLKATDTGSGSACPATLVMEISVDWRVRSVDRVELRGRLFAAATRSTAPPAGPAPSGMQQQLGGLPVNTHITFAADVPALAGGTVESLNAEGTQLVTPGSAQTSSRRYRITIPGFTLDYAGTPHVGLVLEARLRERIPGNRFGPWSPTARLAYASDPRARASVVVDIVRLASLADAAGECHAHIDWAAVPGAIGYALYESTETRILASHEGFPEPTPERTLSQRLTTLKQAFAAAPLRRDFFRRNADLITTTSVDVTLPRGSRDIHLYTVLPVMAGGNEGPWPSGPDADEALIPYVAPRVAEPAPPTIEVQRVEDKPPALPNYRVRLRIGTRGGVGARPKRIDIYRVRVDDAARRLDSMGPPIATLSSSGGGWTIAPPDGGGDWIGSVTGFDTPSGSWRTVWYRAVAWSEDDPLRGVLKGRSLPSPAVSVLVPPPGPPELSALVISWPGSDPAAALVTFTAGAPVEATPVGPHTLSVQAVVAGGSELVKTSASLAAIPTMQPATGSGVWRESSTIQYQYRLLLRRASINDVVSVIVRLTDPLGRTSEQTITVAAGSVQPLPSLSTIDAFSISGRGRVYSFTSDAPATDGFGGVYRIHIELTPSTAAAGNLPLRPGSLRVPPPRGSGVGLPGSITLGGRAPPSPFKLIDGVYVFDGAVSTVPVVSGPTASLEPLLLGRRAAPMDDNFTIFAAIKLSKVLVRIETPDGRTVEQRRRG